MQGPAKQQNQNSDNAHHVIKIAQQLLRHPIIVKGFVFCLTAFFFLFYIQTPDL